MKKFDEKYVLEQFKNLLAIDSTTGMYEDVVDYVAKLAKKMGYKYELTHKGGVIVDLGGKGNDLVLSAHLDDIGLMVRGINADGTLKVNKVGGLYPTYCVTENVRVYTRDGKVYSGSVCRNPGSVHLTENELKDGPGRFETDVCITLDEDVKCKADVEKLGIETGDFIALDPRYNYVNGYIKSRFIDDKAQCAILFNLMKYVKENKVKLNRRVLLYFAVYEEIGHGTTYLPAGVKDFIAVDIAVIGPNNTSDEKKVSIFACDSRFPYHNGLTNELRTVAKKNKIDFVMDVFTPHYGTDGDGSINAGYDIRHAAIGPGTLNSHGYERTHINSLKNTFDLIVAYLNI